MQARLAIAAALLAGVLCGAPAPGAAAEDDARGLLERVRQLNRTSRHWNDRRQRLALTIIDRRGGERHRDLEVLTKKYGEGNSRSILFFRAPAPVRGTGLLQWVEPGEPDRNWLYLPALKRVRQITGATRRESFVGTDFSYEDLAIINEVLDWTEKDAASASAGSETVDGRSCAVIELRPLEADVGYGRIRLWLDREELVVLKYEFDARTGEREKTLLVGDIRPVGTIPSAHRLEMQSVRAGSRTVVLFDEIRYDIGLSDDVFSERRLERGL